MILRHLEIFNMVATEKNFTTAAKKLYITQSAVSHAINQLEKQANTALFDRLPRGVRLTRSGEQLLEQAQVVLTSSNALEKQIATIEQVTPIKIASSITIASFLLPNIIHDIKKSMPNINVCVNVASAQEVISSLKTGQSDIAFFEGTLPEGDFEAISIGSYKIIAACSPEIFKNSQDMSLQQLISYPLLLRERGSAIRERFETMLYTLGEAVIPSWESVNSFSLIKAAKAGLGIVILPKILLAEALEDKSLIEINIIGDKMENEMLAVVDKKRYITRPVMSVLDAIKKQPNF